MPFRRLDPQTKKAARRLLRKKASMREGCWKWQRREIAAQYRLGFWARIKFYMMTSK